MHCHFWTAQKLYHNLNTFHRCLLLLTSFKATDPLANFCHSACNAVGSERCFLQLGSDWGWVRPSAAPAPFPQRPSLQLPLCPHLATYTSHTLAFWLCKTTKPFQENWRHSQLWHHSIMWSGNANCRKIKRFWETNNK